VFPAGAGRRLGDGDEQVPAQGVYVAGAGCGPQYRALLVRAAAGVDVADGGPVVPGVVHHVHPQSGRGRRGGQRMPPPSLAYTLPATSAVIRPVPAVPHRPAAAWVNTAQLRSMPLP
jgi:hypothetical protein